MRRHRCRSRLGRWGVIGRCVSSIWHMLIFVVVRFGLFLEFEIRQCGLAKSLQLPLKHGITVKIVT